MFYPLYLLTEINNTGVLPLFAEVCEKVLKQSKSEEILMLLLLNI
jgi:hypothetical protein